MVSRTGAYACALLLAVDAKIGIRKVFIMCTSVLYDGRYFGRNLDLEISYGQEIVQTPADFPFDFRHLDTMPHHYAITGVATVQNGYPLYFDGANEKGLGMAGLNFDGPAKFFPVQSGKVNVATFEFIPYILGQCASVDEAKQLLSKVNLTDDNFSAQMPYSPLHWIIADKSGKTITVESTKTGLHVYDNPVHVLANNPEFPGQMDNLANYQAVSAGLPQNNLVPGVQMQNYSRGIATRLLPGGVDSESRFVKAAFVNAHTPHASSQLNGVSNYFHIMEAVAQQKNLDEVAPGKFEYTIYTDCMDLENGTLYYTTYEDRQINGVKFDHADGSQLATYPMLAQESVNFLN